MFRSLTTVASRNNAALPDGMDFSEVTADVVDGLVISSEATWDIVDPLIKIVFSEKMSSQRAC